MCFVCVITTDLMKPLSPFSPIRSRPLWLLSFLTSANIPTHNSKFIHWHVGLGFFSSSFEQKRGPGRLIVSSLPLPQCASNFLPVQMALICCSLRPSVSVLMWTASIVHFTSSLFSSLFLCSFASFVRFDPLFLVVMFIFLL